MTLIIGTITGIKLDITLVLLSCAFGWDPQIENKKLYLSDIDNFFWHVLYTGIVTFYKDFKIFSRILHIYIYALARVYYA